MPGKALLDFGHDFGRAGRHNLTACVAALTNIDIIEREGLRDRATEIGARLGAGLRALADDGLIAGVRGEGAMWAAALRPDQDAVALREQVLANGAIVRPIGESSLTFCPPLVMTDDEVDRVIDAVAIAVSA